MGERHYSKLFAPEAAAIITRFISIVVLPGAEEIKRIAAHKQIPVAVFEPMPDILHMLPGFGFKGNPIFPLMEEAKKTLRDNPQEKITGLWLFKPENPGVTKIVGVISSAVLLFNWAGDDELGVESGSLDLEWQS